LRVGLLADFLRDQGYRVTVLSTGRRERVIEADNIVYREEALPSSRFRFLVYAIVAGISRILHWPALRAMLYYMAPNFDEPFARRVRDIGCKHQVVFLEYPFWFNALGSEHHRKTILTNHDVLASSWTKSGPSFLNRPFFRTLLQRELAAMNAATRAVAVSPTDGEFFSERGVRDVVVITNPVAFSENKGASAVKRESIPVKFRSENCLSAALFVGSGWYPNCDAARAIVKDIAPSCPEITFFIAGECSKGIRSHCPNVHLMGAVNSETLAELYRQATFALIPVAWGTGTSLKALEAMARGKVIISTNVGVRGLPFEHEVHGVVCNDTTEYPSLIIELLKDVKRQQLLAENAMKLAELYDYRTVYKTYLELIDEILKTDY
jgi:glycosyltransferase involved in cell wall biosynthesis